MTAVYLDSGIFIALMSKRDHWHPQAVELFSGPVPRWCTSMLIVAEAYSWFLHRMGEEHARAFRKLVDSMRGLQIYPVSQAHHLDVARVLDRYRGSKLTYVDASSLAFIGQKKISRVWATDHHLGLAGAEVVPLS